MPQYLTPQYRLALLLARGNFSAEVARRAAERIHAGVKWDGFLESARTHGLIPLLYHRLKALEFCDVPPHVRRQLTDTFGANAIRNLLLSQELVRVLIQLDTAGVCVIPLKGISLAESLYGDNALRVVADLDILIRPERLETTLHVLQSSGYETRLDRSRFIELLARYGKDCELMREDARMAYPLQVHCGLIWGGPPESAALAELWSGAVPRAFHGAPAFALAPEWEFLYLAVHAARHRFYPLKWLVDLDWLVARGDVDWVKVENMARRLGWGETVQSCFAACEALIQTPVPEPFAKPHDRCARFHVSRPGPLTVPSEALFCLRLLPKLSQRLQYLAIRLFVPTSADREFVALPSSLFFLYGVLRPLRLAGWVVAGSMKAGFTKLRRVLKHRWVGRL